MGPAGFQDAAKIRERRELLQDMDMRHSRLCVPVRHGHPFPVGRMSADGIGKGPVLVDFSDGDGFIDAGYLMCLDLLRQAKVSEVVLGGHHKAARVLVKAVYDPGADDAADAG